MLIGKEKMWLGAQQWYNIPLGQYLSLLKTQKRGGNFKNSIFSYNALHINCNP